MKNPSVCKVRQWQLPKTKDCSAMLTRRGDRWVEAPASHVPLAVYERCSDDENPFGHGGVLEADEEPCTSTQRQRSEIESPEEHRVKSLVLGNGAAHDSHR